MLSFSKKSIGASKVDQAIHGGDRGKVPMTADDDRPMVIKVENLEKIYDPGTPRETKALRGVSFEISQSEIVVLFGQSGSGKSTTLNILAGLDKPTGGKAIVDGKDLARQTDQERVEYHQFKVGMVFQSYNLIDTMTVMHNITMPARLAGFKRSQYTERGYDLLRQFDLEELADRRPSEVSGGQQQRVGIMRAFINRPALIIADEPTGNLDSINSNLIMRLFRELNEKTGTTMVVVTHDPSIFSIADRIIHVLDGTVEKQTILTTRAKVDVSKANVLIEYRIRKEEKEALIREHGGDKTTKKHDVSAESKKEEAYTGPSDFDRLIKHRTSLSPSSKQIVSALMTLLTSDQQDRLELDELLRMLEAIELRVAGSLSEPELRELLDRPFADGGVGLYKQTAAKIASGIEVMIHLGQMEMKKRRRT